MLLPQSIAETVRQAGVTSGKAYLGKVKKINNETERILKKI